MSNRVELSPEIVRLAQSRVLETGTSLKDELARLAVEEAIMTSDPELELVLDSQDALSSIDSITAAVGANDLVVNGRRIDVRAIDDEGYVSVPRKAIVGTPALSEGSFAVALHGTTYAIISAHVKPGQWLAAEERVGDNEAVKVKVDAHPGFIALDAIIDIARRGHGSQPKPVNGVPAVSELEQFLNNPDKFVIARQKQILTALCCNADLRESARQINVSVTHGAVDRMLRAQSTFNKRTEELVDKLSPGFAKLSREEVKRHVTRTAEMLGGQPEAPAFRKALLKKLTGEQLTRQFGGEALAKVNKIYEQVLAGKSSVDAVKQFVKNHVAVDVAVAIKQQRKNIDGLVSATADEIGQAFQKLAIQPAYATHSKSDDGVDAINEALSLLEAAELAERVREAESKLVES